MVGRASAWILGALLLVAVVMMSAWLQVRARTAEDARFPAGSYAYLEDSDRLFRNAPAPVRRTGAAAPNLPSGSHPIRISRDAARRAVELGYVPVVLPDGTRYDVRFEREERAFTGDWTFVGRVDTPIGALASVLTFGPDGVFGTLPAPDGRMFQITTSHGKSTIAAAGGMLPPRDSASTLPEDDLVIPPRQVAHARQSTPAVVRPADELATRPRPTAGAAPVPTNAAASGDFHWVDLLGIYSSDLAALRGSARAAETEYANLVAVSNQAHIDSGTRLRLRLAGLFPSAIPPDLSNTSVLYIVSGGSLPDGLDASTLRQETSADMVAVLRLHAPNDGTCGTAWLNGAGLAPQDANAAFAVSVSNVAPCGPYVMAHEIGHGLGSTHDAPNASFPGAYPFSMGYRQVGPPSFTTVMGYENGIPAIGRFSDPTSMACESKCGTEGADNVRSINLMAERAARFTNPAGTLVVDDVIVGEENDLATATVRVRLGTVAGPGGVTFDLSLVDASASAGLDYVQRSGHFHIAEGESEELVGITILGDRLVEADETFQVVLDDVEGAEALRPWANVTIVDDDPRIRVSGKLVFPPGTPEPVGRYIQMYAYDQGSHIASATIGAPEWRYLVEVPRPADLVLDVNAIAGLAANEVSLGAVDHDIERDITMSKALEVSGRLRFPAGVSPPDSVVDIVLWQRGEAGNWGYQIEAEPPGFEFSMRAFNAGSDVEIEVRPSLPFHAVSETVHDIGGDVREEVLVPVTPVVTHIESPGAREGDPSTPNSVGILVQLSGEAGPGGVTVEFTTASRTAGKGEDFEAYAGTIEIPEGERHATRWNSLRTIGDFDPEADEVFDIVVTGAIGARVLDEVRGEVVIFDDDTMPTLGDVDGDGASDLLWHSRATEKVRWQLIGDGRILGEGERYVGGTYRVLAVDDFTGDGGTDFLFGNETGDKLVFWDTVVGGLRVNVDEIHAAGDWEVIGTADIYANDASFVVSRNGAGDVVRLTWLNSNTEYGSAVATDARLAATGDFDGDGRDELLWQDGHTDRFWLWRSDNGVFFAPVPVHLDVEAGVVFGASDLDGDGREEVLSHSGPGRVLRAWSLDGSTVAAKVDHPLPAHYRLAGMGDYDADGKTDFVWRDARRTGLWMWLARNGTYHENWMGPHPGGDWSPILPWVPDTVSGAGGNGGELTVGDVDRDGAADLVWFNASMHQLDWWPMRGAARAGLRGRAVDPHLVRLAQGDFDGDQADDVLLRDADGRVWLEQVLQEGKGARARVPAVTGLDWAVVGVGDFDGDGRDDLLWWKASAGRWRSWRMDGTLAPREAAIEVPAGLTLEGVGDADGDGRADVAWHDATEGALVLALGGEPPLATVPGGRPPGRQALAAIGDVDGDGNPELIWHALDDGVLRLWRADGAPGADASTPAVPTTYRVAGSGDVDGDGRTDLLWRDHGRGELRAWRWATGKLVDSKVADYPGRHLVVPRIVEDRISAKHPQCVGPLC